MDRRPGQSEGHSSLARRVVRFVLGCLALFLALRSVALADVPFASSPGVVAKYVSEQPCVIVETRPFEFEIEVYGLRPARQYNAIALITQPGYTSVFLATSALGNRMADGAQRYRFYVENGMVSASLGTYRLGLVFVSNDPADAVQNSTGTGITNGARADVIDCTVSR